MKMNRRFLLITLLSLIALGSAFAAGQTDSAPAPEALPADTIPFDDTFSLSWLMGYHPAMGSPPEDMLVVREFEERLNLDVEWTFPPLASFSEKLNTTLASGDLPDLVTMYPADLSTWIGMGAVIEIGDLLDDYGRDILGYYNEADEREIVYPMDGKIYSTVYVNEVKALFTTAIRGDWLEDLGLDVPETLAEFESALLQFRDNRMGGENTIPFIGYIDLFYHSFGIERASLVNGNLGTGTVFVVSDDDEYIPYFEHPNYRACLETMARFYDEGLLDPEFAVRNNDLVEEKIMSGRGGSFWTYANRPFDASRSLRTDDPDAVYLPIEPLEGPFGDKLVVNRPPYGPHTAITRAGEDKAANLMQVINWLYTDEGRTLSEFGVEGVTYEVVDGEPTLKSEYVEFAEKRRVGINIWGRTYGEAGFWQSLLLGQRPEELDDFNREIYYNAYRIGDPFIFAQPRVFTDSEIERLGADVYGRAEELEVRAIMGEISIDEFFQEYDRIKSIGLDEIAVRINEYYGRTK